MASGIAHQGRLTQRLECHPHTVEVTGSNPVPPRYGPKATANRFGAIFLGPAP